MVLYFSSDDVTKTDSYLNIAVEPGMALKKEREGKRLSQINNS